MNQRNTVLLSLLAVGALGLSTAAHAGAAKTTYPVVFAHGMAGFDNLLGYDYWGDDYGMFVGDSCQLFEIGCNEDIAKHDESRLQKNDCLESADAPDLGSGGAILWVRVPLRAFEAELGRISWAE